MTHLNTKQPEALRLADEFDNAMAALHQISIGHSMTIELRRLHTRVQELEEEVAHESQWRDLALQFDGHRMCALGHLKRILDAGCSDDSLTQAQDFLHAPPLSGEKVLAERIAELEAAQAQRVLLSVEAIAEIAELFGATDPTDSFWVEVCRAFEGASVTGITQEKQG